MKILFVSAVMPYPLYSGGQIRIYNLIKLLAQKHKISLFSFIRSRNEEDYANKLDFCEKIFTVLRGHVWQPSYLIRSLFGTYPLLYASYDKPEMRRIIKNNLITKYFDLIHIEPAYVWPSVPKNTVPIVTCEHNIEYQVYQNYVSQIRLNPFKSLMSLDVIKHKNWEQKVWQNSSAVVSVSESDKLEIEKSGQSSVYVVPNGVDINYFNIYKKRHWIDDPLCLFVGHFKWIQNSDSLDYLINIVWPLVYKNYPKARLRIVGRKVPKKHLIQRHAPGLEIRENVTDIRDLYRESDILIAPIRIGGGTRFKILEAMATGLPVITTPVGAMGLPVKSGVNIIVAETPQEFIESINLISRSDKFRLKLTINARKLIENDFSWTKIAEKLDKVWQFFYEKEN